MNKKTYFEIIQTSGTVYLNRKTVLKEPVDSFTVGKNPKILERFDTLEEAEKAFEKYETEVSWIEDCGNNITRCYMVEYQIDERIYILDDDGEEDEGTQNGTYLFSTRPENLQVIFE